MSFGNGEYKVEMVNQSTGFRFAVVCDGHYRFMRKTKDEAQRLADKLNDIRKRRIEATT
jgi:hypothetical protein